MKWLIKKFEGKDLLRIQTKVCLLLVTVMLVLSFGSLYTVDVEVPAQMQNGIATVVSVLNEPEISGGENIEFELPEKLNINILLFIRFASKTDQIVRIYNSMLELAEYANAKTGDEYNAAYHEFKSVAADASDLVTSSEFESAVALAATLVSGYQSSIDRGLVTTLMTVMACVFPTCFIATLLFALIELRINRGKAEKRYLTATKALRRAAKAYFFVLAVKLIGTGIHLSVWLVAGLAVCFAAFLIEAVLSRATRYTDAGRKYLGILQAVSLVHIGGFAVFYLFMSMSGAVGRQFAIAIGNMAKYLISEEYSDTFASGYISVFLGFAIIACLIFVLEAALYSVSRLGGVAPRDRESTMLSSCFGVLMVLLLFFGEPESAKIPLVLLSLLGLALMIGCELMLPRLRKKHCAGLNESEKYAVLTGLEVIELEDEEILQ